MYRECVDRILKGNRSVHRRCRDLADRGILRRGRPWRDVTLGRLLRSTTYKGDLYGNRYNYRYDLRKGKSVSWGKKPKDEWIRIEVPPRISTERWDLLQQRMSNRSVARGGRPKSKETFLLRGDVACGVCGANLRVRREPECYLRCSP